MSLTLATSALRSRNIREDITQGFDRGREILFDIGLPEDFQEEPEEGGFWSGVGAWLSDAWGTLLRVAGAAWAGFTIGGIKGAIIAGVVELIPGISWQSVIQGAVTAVEALSQFNWNASNTEMKQQIKGYNDQIAGIWGELIGRGLGHLTSVALGAGISVKVPVIGSKALMAQVTGEVGIAAFQDLLDNLRAAVSQTAQLWIRSGLFRAYMGARTTLKWLARNTPWRDTAQGRWIINKWGVEGQPDISFTRVRDGKIEEIEDSGWQNFLESGVEGFWDAFKDGLFIVSRELDSAYAAAYSAQRQAMGPQRALEIQPDSENERERLIFLGNERDMMGDAISTLNTYQLIHNRDVGTPGPLTPEGLEIPELQNYRLTLFCYSVSKPPWRTDDGKRAKKVELNIPNPRRNIRWDEIKLALGGTNGYDWGPRYAVGRFESRRKMVVYSDSEENAIARLNALALLSQDALISIQTGTRAYRRNESAETRRRVVRVYPAYLKSVVLRRNTDLSQPGRPDIEGQTWREQSQKIDLWRDQIPANGEIFTLEALPQP